MDGTQDTLKESLGILQSTTEDLADFAIDSDDENETSISVANTPTIVTTSTTTSGNQGSTQLKKLTVSANDDPLSILLNSPASTTTTTEVSNNLAPSELTISTLNSTPNTASSVPSQSYTTSTSSIINTTSVSQTLSSKFSSFASKVQDAVSNATRTSVTPTVNNIPVASHSFNGVNYVERSVEHNNSGFSSATGGVSYNSNYNAAPTVYNANRIIDQNQQQQQQPIYQAGMSSPVSMGAAPLELDNSMKSLLITSAIDELLPGERVIVFLSHLIQVRDSSSPQTGLGSSLFYTDDKNRSDLIWCCVVTFYRLVVFSYHESEFNQSLESNANYSNDTSNKDVDFSTELKGWIDSASVSHQCQFMHLTRLRKSGKRHDVLQMPLASVDRIEKSTEFGLNASPNMTSQIGFSSSAVNLMPGGGGTSSNSIGGAVASGTLVVYGKDNGRFIQFTTTSYADCMRVYESLNTYAFPGKRNLGYLFAFESRRAEVMAGTHSDDSEVQGPKVIGARANPKRYDAIVDFKRMVSLSHDAVKCPWAPISRANSSYSLCASYPSVLFGPSSVDDSKPEGIRLLRDTASFRSGGRFQTLSWASRHDGASLWRSAQPKVGLQGNRSTADELYMKKIAESAALANSQAAINGLMPQRPSIAFLKMLTGCINETDLMLENFGNKESAAFNEKCMLKILDLRPVRSAMANKTQGYGYESTSNYKNTTISFFGIANIHAVRDSYNKISALCASPVANDVQWMSLVEDTKWLSHIRLILSASWQAAFHVRYNRLPVLVHCSHGWDRTSQVCALAQLFLDPYYRTFVGFSCLVEKDFLALGHPFHTRCGHGEGKGGDQNGSGTSNGQSDDISPIFLQFLDCVFQIVNQYPDYFEFNTKYLLLISEHIYSCRFGNLLCDTEREREVVASVRQRTYCLWEYLESCPDLVNKNYSKAVDFSDSEIVEGKGCLFMPLPSLLRNVTLWVDRHCMHGAKPTMRYSPANLHQVDGDVNLLQVTLNEASKWKEITKQKEEEILRLKNQLKDAQTMSINQ